MKMKVKEIESVSQAIEIIKKGRYDTQYILVDKFQYTIGSYSELQDTIKTLERLIQLQRHHNIRVRPSIIFEKIDERKKRRKQ